MIIDEHAIMDANWVIRPEYNRSVIYGYDYCGCGSGLCVMSECNRVCEYVSVAATVTRMCDECE